MAGIIVTSISTGRLISRIGRYKWFRGRRYALMAIGLLSFTRLYVNTPLLAGVSSTC